MATPKTLAIASAFARACLFVFKQLQYKLKNYLAVFLLHQPHSSQRLILALATMIGWKGFEERERARERARLAIKLMLHYSLAVPLTSFRILVHILILSCRNRMCPEMPVNMEGSRQVSCDLPMRKFWTTSTAENHQKAMKFILWFVYILNHAMFRTDPKFTSRYMHGFTACRKAPPWQILFPPPPPVITTAACKDSHSQLFHSEPEVHQKCFGSKM